MKQTTVFNKHLKFKVKIIDKLTRKPLKSLIKKRQIIDAKNQ